MAAAAAAAGSGSGLGRVTARSRPGPSRFRGCLAGALLGDCLGAVFEGRSVVKLPDLLRFLRGLEPTTSGPPEGEEPTETLSYTDDTAMSRSVVQSLLAKREFDEVDMAKRFAEEYKKEPNRGYGMAVVNVFKKLLSPKCNDVFEPARAQFNGKGSYGNGGAMRVAGIPLVYSDVQDVKKFAKLSAELTHANSLGYNGAILQALAVHLALQGELSKETFLEQLISHMEDVEADDKSLTDARALGFEDLPFSRRLKKIKEFLELSSVPKADVLFELGIGVFLRGSPGWREAEREDRLQEKKQTNETRQKEKKKSCLNILYSPTGAQSRVPSLLHFCGHRTGFRKSGGLEAPYAGPAVLAKGVGKEEDADEARCGSGLRRNREDRARPWTWQQLS